MMILMQCIFETDLLFIRTLNENVTFFFFLPIFLFMATSDKSNFQLWKL